MVFTIMVLSSCQYNTVRTVCTVVSDMPRCNDHVRQVFSHWWRLYSKSRTKSTFLRDLCFPEPSQMRARIRSIIRMRWNSSFIFIAFSWKKHTWCGKHIPLSFPLSYLSQTSLYTVIAPKCIVSSCEESEPATLCQCCGKVLSLLLWRRPPFQRHHLAAELCPRYRRAL